MHVAIGHDKTSLTNLFSSKRINWCTWKTVDIWWTSKIIFVVDKKFSNFCSFARLNSFIKFAILLLQSRQQIKERPKYDLVLFLSLFSWKKIEDFLVVWQVSSLGGFCENWVKISLRENNGRRNSGNQPTKFVGPCLCGEFVHLLSTIERQTMCLCLTLTLMSQQ